MYALEHPTEANISIEKWNAEIERITVQQLREEILNHVDLKQVRHGKWACCQPCPICRVDRFDGLDADIWADWKPNYCPHCGAEMLDE